MSADSPKKVLPFQTWRPLTPEEAQRVPPGLRFVRVSRVSRRAAKGSKASQPEADVPSSDRLVTGPIPQRITDRETDDRA